MIANTVLSTREKVFKVSCSKMYFLVNSAIGKVLTFCFILLTVKGLYFHCSFNPSSPSFSGSLTCLSVDKITKYTRQGQNRGTERFPRLTDGPADGRTNEQTTDHRRRRMDQQKRLYSADGIHERTE